jgi:alkanesulfonate monooxygenase SsuD/methylene tetrahydromethanopterin reductase-like flavin-dependent oxidoreductase (luciferase family)
MVGVSVICAPSDDEARWLSGSSALSILQLHTGRLGPMPTPEAAAAYDYTSAERDHVDRIMATHVIGNPTLVAKELAALADRTGANELILSTRLHGFDARARSLELVMSAWQAATT